MRLYGDLRQARRRHRTAACKSAQLPPPAAGQQHFASFNSRPERRLPILLPSNETLAPPPTGPARVAARTSKELHMISAFLPAVAGHDISGYLRDIRKFPMLTAEEETELARRWWQRQDLDAAHALVTSHLRLVAKIARRYRGYGLPLSELIGEGNIGMLQAVKRFDPERGFRLATYAMWWIRAAMQEYILHNWSLVKIGTTGAQKKLFFNLRRLKAELQAIDTGDLAAEQVSRIARLLDVPEPDVVNMNRRLAAPDHSLNAPVRGDDTEGEWQDWLVDESAGPETTLAEGEELAGRTALLPDALRSLNERQLHIVRERWLRDDPSTLEALAQQYGISRERVRQIEAAAFKKMRAAMGAPTPHPTAPTAHRRHTSAAVLAFPARPTTQASIPAPPPAEAA
jgi:RNA polymerase sigma-32 factor